MQNRSAIWIFTILLAIASIYQISFSFVTSGVEKDAARFAKQQAQPYMDSAKIDAENPVLRDSVLNMLTNRRLREVGNKPAYPVLGFTYNDCLEREMKIGLDLKGGMNVTLEVSIPDLIKNLAANKAKNADFKAVLNAARDRMSDSNDDFITVFADEWEKRGPDIEMVEIFNNRTYKDKFPRDLTNEQVVGVLRSEANEAINSTERILRTRIDRFGVTQPTIQKQGFSGRILIELPGVKDKEGVRRILQSTANLEFYETFDNYEANDFLVSINDYWAAKLSPDFDSLLALRDSLVVLDSIATAELAADSLNTDSLNPTVDPTDTLLANNDTTPSVSALDSAIAADLAGGSDSLAADTSTLKGQIEAVETELFKISDPMRNAGFQYALFRNEEAGGQLQWQEGPTIGYVHENDTSDVNALIRNEEALATVPPTLDNLRLLWGNKASEEGYLPLYCIKVPTDGKAILTGETVTNAAQDFNQVNGGVEVNLQFNQKGTIIWKEMTGANVGRSIAIVLDDQVYSAPNVIGAIPSGNTVITFGQGADNETIREAQLLATVLKAGSLPAPAQIVEEAVVGPSLGEKNVQSGLWSFAFALLLVLLYMIFYYAKAGLVSNVALLANIFFLFGAMASLQASLTLPGIAGIVLTIGMSVDANVLIYERIREEIRAGKGMRLAIMDGYKRAYAAIIDANITTFLTALVLFIFGSGPIKGFATTLMIGIITSLFSAIFITRLIFMWQLDRKKNITFASSITKNAFTKVNIGFLNKRRLWYTVSSLIIIGGIASLTVRGLNQGVDFTGGRTYVVQFEQLAQTDAVKAALAGGLESTDGKKVSLEVKTIEAGNQLKITTNYRNGEKGLEVQNQVDNKIIELTGSVDPSVKIMQSNSVDPTISDDIRFDAGLAIVFSLLIIFLYIVFRFRKWQFGLGALVAMMHDVMVVLSLFSIFYGILPFSMEIDQAFIAAILTVVGYSINDTVVVFDRIREHLSLYKRKSGIDVVNGALNSTLSRTVNTSLSTFLVLLVIFIFGGEAIRGFTFALMAGVIVGTYSSLCIATPLSVDLAKALRRKANPLATDEETPAVTAAEEA